MRISINPDECIGCGVCMQICPRVFSLDDDEGRAILMGAEYTKDELELVKEAIDNCPVGCITE